MSVFRLAAPWTLLSWGVLVLRTYWLCAFCHSRGQPRRVIGPQRTGLARRRCRRGRGRVVVAARPTTASSLGELPADARLQEAASSTDKAPPSQPEQRLR